MQNFKENDIVAYQNPIKRLNPIRWIHKKYAEYMGYFWVPCPICGNYFGWHEIADNLCSIKYMDEDMEPNHAHTLYQVEE